MVNGPANERLYLGVDGGGSKCRARVSNSEGQILGVGLAGAANPLHGVEHSQSSIVAAAERALERANLPREHVNRLVAGIGLAGVNLPSLCTIMHEWRHPFADMHLTTDLHIACLGAHAQDNGAVIITGTGSCGYVCVDGRSTVLGAHGFPFGDKGSGAWMGLKAVEAVLLASDQLGPDTTLTERVGDHLQAQGLMIVERLSGAKPREFAQLAPLVFAAAEASDQVALAIVQEGASYISGVAHKLLEYDPPRLSMLGGLADRLTPWLDTQIAERLSPPLGPPEAGAIFYAKAQSAREQ